MNDERKEVDGVVVFRPGARIVDQTSSRTYLDPIKDAVNSGKRIVLDLSEIQFLNSAGLGVIVGLVRDAKGKGGGLRLCSPTTAVKALFSMVHIENIAFVDPDVETALSALSGAGS